MLRIILFSNMIFSLLVACAQPAEFGEYAFEPLKSAFSGTAEEYRILVLGDYEYILNEDQRILQGSLCPNFQCKVSSKLKVAVSDSFNLEKLNSYEPFDYFHLTRQTHVNSYNVLGEEFILLFADKEKITHMFALNRNDPIIANAFNSGEILTFNTLAISIVQSKGPYTNISCNDVIVESPSKSDFDKHYEIFCDYPEYSEGFTPYDKNFFLPVDAYGRLYIAHLFPFWPISDIDSAFIGK